MKNSDVIAFGDLYDRSVANGKSQLLDRIAVRDYVIKAEIGAFQSERGKKQRLRVSVVLEVDLVKSNKHDDVDNIISYDTIIDAINKQLSIERINLLETFADQVATDVLSDFRVKRAFVRVEKLDRIPGALGVEIVRSQQISVKKDACLCIERRHSGFRVPFGSYSLLKTIHLAQGSSYFRFSFVPRAPSN